MSSPHIGSFRLVLLAAIVALGAVGISSKSVSAISDPMAGIPSTLRDYQEFPRCSGDVTTFCVKSAEIDLNNDGVFEPIGTNGVITFSAWMFSLAEWKRPSMSWELRQNGGQELSPAVPVGTASTFEINTGTFRPTPSLFTQQGVEFFDIYEENGSWITKATLRTSSYVVGMNCSWSSDCDNPKDLREYKSFGQGILFYSERSALEDSKHGMWVSTDASSTGELQFNQSTMTWTIDLAGPAKKSDGSPNYVKYNTFLPDAFIQYAYGTTPDLLARNLIMTREEKDETIAVTATITRVLTPKPGIIISLPDIRFFGEVVKKTGLHAMGTSYSTSPQFKIKPKSPLLRAPALLSATRNNVKKTARIIGSRVTGASRYQAMCTKGAAAQFGTSKTPSVLVQGLTSGTWKCQIRGISKLGGQWSKRANVSIK